MQLEEFVQLHSQMKFYRCLDIDYVAIGEGENSVVGLAAYIKTGNDYSQLNLYRDEDGTVKINEKIMLKT